MPLAKKRTPSFAKTFIDAGVKVVYLVDLVTEVISLSPQIKDEFIHQFVAEASIHSNTLKEITIEYLKAMTDNRQVVLVAIAGIKKTDLPNHQIKF